jgi:hypothetical protein
MHVMMGRNIMPAYLMFTTMDTLNILTISKITITTITTVIASTTTTNRIVVVTKYTVVPESVVR